MNLIVYGLICENKGTYKSTYESEELATIRELIKRAIKKGKATHFRIYQRNGLDFKLLVYGDIRKIVDNDKEKNLESMLKISSPDKVKQIYINLIKLLLD